MLQSTLTLGVVLLCTSAGVTAHRRPHSRKGSAANARQNSNPWCAILNQGVIQEEECADASKNYCGLDPNTGDSVGCVSPSQCPASVPNDFSVTCDATSAHCCCQDDPTAPFYCNNLKDPFYDSVWQQACGLVELSDKWFCQKCMEQDAFGQREEEGCRDMDTLLCGIDASTGLPSGCVSTSECPPLASGYPVECDGTRYCCCKDDPSANIRCNDITHPTDDTVRKQACGLTDLSVTDICQMPAPTPPPPPPPMPQECLDYCKAKATRGIIGAFKAFCGNPDPIQNTWKCPAPCPLGCDNYCEDGENMDCPAIIQLPPQTPGPAPVGKTPAGPSKPEPEETKQKGFTAWEITGISVAVLIAALIIALVIIFYFTKKDEDKESAPTAPAPTPEVKNLPEVEPQPEVAPPPPPPPAPPQLPPPPPPQHYESLYPQYMLPGWYPRQEGFPYGNNGAPRQNFTQSAQFALQQANTANYYPQGATSSMPNISYQ